MAIYNDELLPCTSFEEFCDVAGKQMLFNELNPTIHKNETIL
jgi:hypothetical protein